MDRKDLLQVTRFFQFEKLTRSQIKGMIEDRAALIKPLLKFSTLERLIDQSFIYEGGLCGISNRDLARAKGILHIHTQAIFGMRFPTITLEKRFSQVSTINKLWGLCRDSTWCYGEIEINNKGRGVSDIKSIDIRIVDLDELLEKWPTWQDIWNRLGAFVLADREKSEKRYLLANKLAKIIEIGNLLAEKALEE